MTMSRLIPVVALVALVTACGHKSYSYEVAVTVSGTGSAEVTVEYPAGSDQSPDNKPSRTTSTEQLPFNRKILALGLGHVSVSAKSADGKPVKCAVVVEKEDPVQRAGGDTVKCDADITESTDN